MKASISLTVYNKGTGNFYNRWHNVWLSEEHLILPFVFASGNNFINDKRAMLSLQQEKIQPEGIILPEIIQTENFKVFIQTEESLYENERSQVVCGLSGKMLKPYYLTTTARVYEPEWREYVYGKFSVLNGAIIINGKQNSDEVVITEVKASVKNNTLFLETKVLFKGEYMNLFSARNQYNRYYNAAQIAYKKVNDTTQKHFYFPKGLLF